MAFAQAREQVEVARARAPERPVEPHANLAQRPRRLRQGRDERLRGGRRELRVEGQREAMGRAEVGEKLELVARGGQQPRGGLRTQDAQRMRIEGDDDRRRARFAAGVVDGAADDGAVAEVDAVKDADGQVRGPECRRARGVNGEFPRAGRGRGDRTVAPGPHKRKSRNGDLARDDSRSGHRARTWSHANLMDASRVACASCRLPSRSCRRGALPRLPCARSR